MGAKGLTGAVRMLAAAVLPVLASAVLAGTAWAGEDGTAAGEPLAPDDLKAGVPPLQWTLTLENGGGILGNEDWSVREGVYHFGGHANMFIKRKGPGAWAGGVAMTAGSLDMKMFMAGAGVAVLMPVSDFLPLIVEAFPLYLRGGKKNSMAVGGRLWWGLHSFNFHGSEVATLGLYMIFQKVVLSDDSKLWFAVWGIDFSLHILAIPFGMAGQAMVRKKHKRKNE